MDGTKPLIRVFETYAQLTPSHEREGVFGEQLAPGAAGDSGKRPSALAWSPRGRGETAEGISRWYLGGHWSYAKDLVLVIAFAD